MGKWEERVVKRERVKVDQEEERERVQRGGGREEGPGAEGCETWNWSWRVAAEESSEVGSHMSSEEG